ncbi:YicC family protein [Desulfovibrio sp. OttesenSCG-928-A18]|nr:YicC family protein [Desulfovibrio sp. OttesenSCG-928-A18]
MLRSMTGFGRSFLEEERWTQIWEVRSVNGRHLDVRWRLPMPARALEPALEKLVKRHASRGRVEVSLFLQMHRADLQSLAFNEEQADAMLQTLSDFAASRGDAYSPDYNRLLALGFLWDEGMPESDDALSESLERGLGMALEDWNESRAMEARALEKDLLTRILRMEEWVLRISERAPDIKEERFLLVRERLSEILERQGLELDENRFLQELVIMADKLDVSEELTRLDAHLDRLRELLQIGADAGRKLDFTMQECFREIATCGNKIQDVHVSRLVVDLKNELEKCREQVQNVE